jgi:hypothetical protein
MAMHDTIAKIGLPRSNNSFLTAYRIWPLAILVVGFAATIGWTVFL